MHETEFGPGDLVAIPLPSGLFGLVWIITASAEYGFHLLVMDGYWPARPTARDVRKARPARAERQLLPGYDDVWKGWFQGRVPGDFHVVGRRAPSAQAKAYIANASGTMIFGTAASVRDEMHRRWRWKHDRAAIEAEHAAARARRDQAAAERRTALTLPKLLRERLFATWTDRWPPRVVREARRIFRDATKELIALERGGTKRARAKVLLRITTELNALDDKEGCIESVERDELVARVEELARLVGIENTNEKLTGHRDW